ncbi:MAG TPA: hypothetical protein VFA58_02290 [Chthoniobacterales bacterium]|nr:hypothetical protein [Chthoniobacterales bacterium]
MRAKIVSLFLILAGTATVNAQSPAPVIVQPANAPAASLSASKTMAAPGAEAQSIPAAIKLLEQLKAANDEVLGKQKAALSKLDELQDSADQLRIFAKRG